MTGTTNQSTGTFARYAPTLHKADFEVIPVEGKRPVVRGWQKVDLTEAAVDGWAKNGYANHNVGIRTDLLAAIDIDIYDEAVADRVVAALEARFGIAPKRIGQAPKALLVYRAEKPGRKITSPTWTDPGGRQHRVEVLGQGQQFVAFGTHPDTGKPYRWPGEVLTDVDLFDLPPADRDEVAAWIAEELPKLIPSDWTCGARGPGHAAAGVDDFDPLDAYKPRHDDVDIDALRWMLNALPHEKCDDRESWRNVIFAAHHQFHGTDDEDAALALVDAWSARSNKYKADEVKRIWREGSTLRNAGVVTVGTLKHWLGDAWKAHRKARVAEALEAARATVEAAILTAATDPTAHLRREVMDAFKTVREADQLGYEIARTRMKQANRLIRMEALDSFTGDAKAEQKSESAATALADLAAEQCELWHDADGVAYASFERGGDAGVHREHWKIESTGFREWLSWLAHTSLGAAPASETINATCNALAGKAKFDGEDFSPARRVARTDEGFWLDLCDDLWRAVLVTASGWRIIDRPPVRFIRTKAMRPLPDPARGGSVERLWPLVNVPEADRPLVLAWMLEAMRAGTPYPVLELIGEQGSAKSTTQETIRAFIDPNKVMLRGRPKTVEDVFVAAGSNHVISLENLSGISAELSDALCTIATGGGQAGRQLFTNDEENIIEAHSPVMVNGIGAVITRPDLLDRAIAIGLPAIEARITEVEHAEALERDAPAILGGLLDLFADALARLPDVSIDPKDLPRMADFAHLGEAMHRAQGGAPGEWLALYTSHRADAVRRVVDTSPVAQACIEFVESGGRHAGTVKALLEALNARAGMGLIERGDYWPRSPRGLGDALRRAAPALRQIGIHAAIESKPRRDGIHCELRAANGCERVGL